MICPKCKKNNSIELSVNFNSKKNLQERIRKCSDSNCSYVFNTSEKIIKKRKKENRTKWLEFKIECYIQQLFINIFNKLQIYLQKNNLENAFKKYSAHVYDIYSNKRGNIEVKIVGLNKKNYSFTLRGLKALTIRQILRDKNYWKMYELIHKKEPSNELKLKEENQFAKSIIHKDYGIKSKKFDINFYRKNEYFSHVFKNMPDTILMQIINKLH